MGCSSATAPVLALALCGVLAWILVLTVVWGRRRRPPPSRCSAAATETERLVPTEAAGGGRADPETLAALGRLLHLVTTTTNGAVITSTIFMLMTPTTRLRASGLYAAALVVVADEIVDAQCGDASAEARAAHQEIRDNIQGFLRTAPDVAERLRAVREGGCIMHPRLATAQAIRDLRTVRSYVKSLGQRCVDDDPRVTQTAFDGFVEIASQPRYQFARVADYVRACGNQNGALFAMAVDDGGDALRDPAAFRALLGIGAVSQFTDDFDDLQKDFDEGQTRCPADVVRAATGGALDDARDVFEDARMRAFPQHVAQAQLMMLAWAEACVRRWVEVAPDMPHLPMMASVSAFFRRTVAQDAAFIASDAFARQYPRAWKESRDKASVVRNHVRDVARFYTSCRARMRRTFVADAAAALRAIREAQARVLAR